MSNPPVYEHVYGFDIFDTIHNFFPEIMYDTDLFTNDMETWFRYRLSVLFPAMYTRQQNLYRIYRSNTVRSEYDNWRQSNDSFITRPVPMRFGPASSSRNRVNTQRNIPRTNSIPATPIAAQTSRTGINSRINQPYPVQTNPMPSQPMEFRRVVRTPNVIQPSPESLLISILNPEIRNEMSILSNLATHLWRDMDSQEIYTDVLVAPSAQHIERASTIQENSQIPPETVCAICQDHETSTPTNTWRILHCHHSFHTNCIDTWFEQNVHCPVCRTDIRDLAESQPQIRRRNSNMTQGTVQQGTAQQGTAQQGTAHVTAQGTTQGTTQSTTGSPLVNY